MTAKTKDQILTEATKEIYAVSECYAEQPQEITGALISVACHVARKHGLTLIQLQNIIERTWGKYNEQA